jgi:hypothetical protein
MRPGWLSRLLALYKSDDIGMAWPTRRMPTTVPTLRDAFDHFDRLPDDT